MRWGWMTWKDYLKSINTATINVLSLSKWECTVWKSVSVASSTHRPSRWAYSAVSTKPFIIRSCRGIHSNVFIIMDVRAAKPRSFLRGRGTIDRLTFRGNQGKMHLLCSFLLLKYIFTDTEALQPTFFKNFSTDTLGTGALLVFTFKRAGFKCGRIF